MENNRKFYIVSFSDSKKYKLTVPADGNLSMLSDIESKLNTYLKSLYPDETFAYYTTPRLTEISWEHRNRYASYPELNLDALGAIKAELRREVKIENELHQENCNAPYASVAHSDSCH